jgi:L-aminopeptidase/D-esterase-like protein
MTASLIAKCEDPPVEAIVLPEGFSCGHATHHEAWTGCTVLLAPAGCVGSGEVRGGGPGTYESDLLSPGTSTPGPQAVLLTGGSAFGLAAADGVTRWLAENEIGHPTPMALVPLVSGAVVYDLLLGDASTRPGSGAGYAACGAAGPVVERGSIGAGTGCTVGKLLGRTAWTKGGVGAARVEFDGASMVAIAVVNPIGDVIAADGSVAAGAWRDGAFVPAVELLQAGARPPLMTAERQNTTLVCLATDALLTKTEAWQMARAASPGVARAISPCATAHDGDMVFCLSSGMVEIDRFVLSALAAEVTSAAIRDAVDRATAAPGCPTAAERRAAGRGGGGG